MVKIRHRTPGSARTTFAHDRCDGLVSRRRRFAKAANHSVDIRCRAILAHLPLAFEAIDRDLGADDGLHLLTGALPRRECGFARATCPISAPVDPIVRSRMSGRCVAKRPSAGEFVTKAASGYASMKAKSVGRSRSRNELGMYMCKGFELECGRDKDHVGANNSSKWALMDGYLRGVRPIRLLDSRTAVKPHGDTDDVIAPCDGRRGSYLGV